MPKIYQAEDSQTSKIAKFLEHAVLVHRHLDWTPLFDWIGVPPFLVHTDKDQITGVLACPQDPDKVSWVKCFGCDKTGNANDLFGSMLIEAKRILTGQIDFIYALGLQNWFVNVLVHNDFQFFQDVVVLSLSIRLHKFFQTSHVFTRPMELSDLPAVTNVDHESFEPIWTISSKGLEAAFLQSSHAAVAEIDRKIVGYEITTANDFSAHLARVAVAPNFQHAQIGFQLVNEMITHFIQNGITSITVNTQSNNTASLNLYKKVGFKETGDRFPVFRSRV